MLLDTGESHGSVRYHRHKVSVLEKQLRDQGLLATEGTVKTNE